MVHSPTRSLSQEPPFSPSTPRLRLTDPDWIPSLLPIVIAALDEREWDYTVNDPPTFVSFGVSADHAAYHCAIFVDDDARLVTMLAQSTLRVPPDERSSVCELLTRANCGLLFGNFDLDFNDGEVRYKVSVDVEGGTLGIPTVHTMISTALDMYELWYPPLMKVIYGGVTPRNAVAEVEARIAEEGDGS